MPTLPGGAKMPTGNRVTVSSFCPFWSTWTTAWRKGHSKTQAQIGLGLGESGGAEPLPISEAWGHIADESDPSSNLEKGIEQTNLRKLPLCQVIVKNPLGQLWLVGKDVLQGARNGR